MAPVGYQWLASIFKVTPVQPWVVRSEIAGTRDSVRDGDLRREVNPAEALAEMLHLRVCQCHWGYVEDEDLSNQDLTAEGYQGIRPALGYPACPDHMEKDILWRP